jgi:glycosyltransferase involved in cell wall biosynthesis
LPVVVSDVADMAEIARNNETGFLIGSPQAAEAFSKAIMKLLGDASLYQKCSQSALNLIRRKHCFGAATQTWRDILGVN